MYIRGEFKLKQNLSLFFHLLGALVSGVQSLSHGLYDHMQRHNNTKIDVDRFGFITDRKIAIRRNDPIPPDINAMLTELTISITYQSPGHVRLPAVDF